MSRRITGICHICGDRAELTFEHIPPKAAGNNSQIRVVPILEAMSLGPDDPIPKGAIQQRAAGGHTLCLSCNRKMGRWYNPQYLRILAGAMEILNQAEGKPTLTYLYHCLPLPVLKQIVSMFFSINSERFQATNRELVDFVLNPEKKYLPEKYRFWIYFNYEGELRNFAVSAILNTESGRTSQFSELTFPPFGYVMTLGTLPTDDRLCEITHFRSYRYAEYAPLELKIPVLPTWVRIPGDYRQRDELVGHSETDPK